MKIYVAGPMTGLPEFNYPAFIEAARMLRELGYEVYNPVDTNDNNPNPEVVPSWEWYMREGLKMVLECDGIALLPGWATSRGAMLERHVAESLKMEIRPLHEWLKMPVVEPVCDGEKVA